MKRKILIIIGIVIVVFGALFTLYTFFGLGQKKSGEVVIGHPACITGKYSKAGAQAIGGIKACIKWVNDIHGGIKAGGKTVKLVYKNYDCRSEKDLVISLIQDMMSADNVNFVFAPYSSGLTLFGAVVAEQFGVLYMDHGGASDRIFKESYQYIVQTIGPASRYHAGTLDMLNKIDPVAKKLALLYKDAEFSEYVMRGAENRAKELGFDIVFRRTYPPGVSDLKPLLRELKESKPDVVLGGGHYKDGLLFAQQMEELNINVKACSLVACAALPTFYKDLGSFAEGMMGPSHWEYGVKYSPQSAREIGLSWFGPKQDEFVRLFRSTMGRNITPGYHAAEAGAAVLALAKAIEMCNSLESKRVRAALDRLRFMSFYGSWDVDDTGKQTGHSMVVMQWQDGKRVIVWPPEAATGSIKYPLAHHSKEARAG